MIKKIIEDFLAAHCFLDKKTSEEDELHIKNIRALFGAHNFKDAHEPERFSLSPNKKILHEEWNPWTTQYDADLSLLQFEQGSIKFGSYVQPICLWDAENDLTLTEGLVVGWGSADGTNRYEDVPKLIKVPTLNNEHCLPGQGNLADYSSLRTFCAGLNGSSVCFGDSGSGLLTQVDGRYYIVGIVSSSPIKNNMCDVSRNAIYTNVLKFKEWITLKTGGAGENHSSKYLLIHNFLHILNFLTAIF